MRILVYQSSHLVKTFDVGTCVQVGRADPSLNDPAPLALSRLAGACRLVVALPHERSIPRHWFTAVQEDGQPVQLRNVHSSLPLVVPNGQPLMPGECQTFAKDVLIDLGASLAIRIESEKLIDDAASDYRTLASAPVIPGENSIDFQANTLRQLADGGVAGIADFLRLALHVVQQASGGDAFFDSAVSATAQIVDLDRSVLLLRDRFDSPPQRRKDDKAVEGWHIAAAHQRQPFQTVNQRIDVSSTLISRVVQSGSTVIHQPDQFNHGQSLKDVEFAVASPIFDSNRQVIGILYGDRGRHADPGNHSDSAISDIEATLVEIIAGGLAGGIARQAEEKWRSTLSSFFSPKVASQLASDPKLMQGRDCEVSVLFCDIRRFSSVTEKLGPQKAIAWINDVMTELSDCVLQRDGVLVDYVGDELMAMWGAPGNQTDHAIRSIEAALSMLDRIECLRERWGDLLPEAFGAGIGVSSGPARVGNVGSKQKFKYGALGNTVNLGSRLQSATKQLGVNCILSGETVRATDWINKSRRIAKLSVVGISEPIMVFEAVGHWSNENWRGLRDGYQTALDHFECSRFHESARCIGEIMPQYPDDFPSRKLLARVLEEMDGSSRHFDGVWKLSSK